MIGSGITGDISKKVVAQRKLLGVSPVGSDVGLVVLLAHRPGSAFEPSRVIVRKRALRRIGSVRQVRNSVNAGERPKVAVESVVFFKDDNDVGLRRK